MRLENFCKPQTSPSSQHAIRPPNIFFGAIQVYATSLVSICVCLAMQVLKKTSPHPVTNCDLYDLKTAIFWGQKNLLNKVIGLRQSKIVKSLCQASSLFRPLGGSWSMIYEVHGVWGRANDWMRGEDAVCNQVFPCANSMNIFSVYHVS